MAHALVVHLPRVAAAAVACILCKRFLFRRAQVHKPQALVRQASAPKPERVEAADLSSVPVEDLTTEPGRAPDLTPEFKEIVACDLPCTVQDFFAVVFSSRSDVIPDTHKACGQFDLAKGRWQKCADSAGLTRTFNFVTPVSGPVGPKQTRVAQQHEVHLYSDGVLVYRSTQQNLDIPFKECFSVQLTWRLTPSPGGGCHLAVALAVPFTKWCAFKGIIQSTTTKETVAFFQLLVKNIQQAVAAAPAGTYGASAPVATSVPASLPAASKGPEVPAGDAEAAGAGGLVGKLLVVVAVMCCAVQLWVFSQVWAVGVHSGGGGQVVAAVEEWQALAGAGAAVLSLLMCLMLIK